MSGHSAQSLYIFIYMYIYQIIVIQRSYTWYYINIIGGYNNYNSMEGYINEWSQCTIIIYIYIHVHISNYRYTTLIYMILYKYNRRL
jgi:hypothetical protein